MKKRLFDELTYRLILPVNRVIALGQSDYYPECPRCKKLIDREYQSFCDHCGQHLGWQHFADANITVKE